MKTAYKVFLVIIGIVFMHLGAAAATVIEDAAAGEPSNEPLLMFLLGIGLIRFSVMIRKRLVK